MLAGHRPWEGETIYTIIYNQKYEPLPSLGRVRPDIPRRVQRAIERALAKDRDLRWPTAGAFSSALLQPVRASGAVSPAGPLKTRPGVGARAVGALRQSLPSRRREPPPPTTRIARPEATTEVGATVLPGRRLSRAVARVAAIAVVSIVTGALMRVITPLHPVPAPRAVPAAPFDTTHLTRPVPLPAANKPATSRDTVVTATWIGRTASAPTGSVRPIGPTATAADAERTRRSQQLSAGDVALPGGSPTVGERRAVNTDTVAHCRSPAERDQRACLFALVADGNSTLTHTYDRLEAALRRTADARAGAPDPTSVRRLQTQHEAWLAARDIKCWHAGPVIPPLWAADRARCLDAETQRRTAELLRELKRLGVQN
jgi:uncharacterized protein YecT (DUF1311 family)